MSLSKQNEIVCYYLKDEFGHVSLMKYSFDSGPDACLLRCIEGVDFRMFYLGGKTVLILKLLERLSLCLFDGEGVSEDITCSGAYDLGRLNMKKISFGGSYFLLHDHSALILCEWSTSIKIVREKALSFPIEEVEFMIQDDLLIWVNQREPFDMSLNSVESGEFSGLKNSSPLEQVLL